MRTEGEEVHVSEEEASGGSKEGVVRWVLVIGLILAIAALSIIWITGAASSDDPMADNVNVSAKVAAQEDARASGGDTDSIVTTATTPAGASAQPEREVQNGVPVVNN